MTISEARARLHKMGRWAWRATSGRYFVRGVYGSVRACDLVTIAQAFEKQKEAKRCA